MTRPVAVIDIDGVVADVRHRLRHVETRPKNWAAFFGGMAKDPPLAEGLAVVETLAADHDIVFLTGRPERYRRVTERWLEANGLPFERVVMRSNSDRRPARLTKADELRSIAKDRTVAVVVDDDLDVCAALEAGGWPVLRADWVPRPEAMTEAQRGGRT